MTKNNRLHYDQLVGRRESACEVFMGASHITLCFDKVYPKTLERVAEEM